MGSVLKTSAAALALATLPVAGAVSTGSATTAGPSPTGTSVARHEPDHNHRNSSTYMLECVEDQLRERPRKFVTGCADAKEYLNKLTWKGWGHNRARATGVLTVEPTYADKQRAAKRNEPVRAKSYPVTVVADKLVRREATQVYSRLKVTFTGKKAPGEPRTMVITLPR